MLKSRLETLSLLLSEIGLSLSGLSFLSVLSGLSDLKGRSLNLPPALVLLMNLLLMPSFES